MGIGRGFLRFAQCITHEDFLRDIHWLVIASIAIFFWKILKVIDRVISFIFRTH